MTPILYVTISKVGIAILLSAVWIGGSCKLPKRPPKVARLTGGCGFSKLRHDRAATTMETVFVRSRRHQLIAGIAVQPHRSTHLMSKGQTTSRKRGSATPERHILVCRNPLRMRACRYVVASVRPGMSHYDGQRHRWSLEIACSDSRRSPSIVKAGLKVATVSPADDWATVGSTVGWTLQTVVSSVWESSRLRDLAAWLQAFRRDSHSP